MNVQGVIQPPPSTAGILLEGARVPIPIVLHIFKYSCTSPHILSKLRCLSKRITQIVGHHSFGVDVLNRLAPGGKAEQSVLTLVEIGFTKESFTAAQALLSQRWDWFNRISIIPLTRQNDIKEFPAEWHFAVAKKKIFGSAYDPLGITLFADNGSLSNNELIELGVCAAHHHNMWDVVEIILEKKIDLSHLKMKVLKWPHCKHDANKVCSMIDNGVVLPQAMIIKHGQKRPLLDLAIELGNDTTLAANLIQRGCPQFFIDSEGNLKWLLTEFLHYQLNKEMEDLLISRAKGQEWLANFKNDLNCLLFAKIMEDPNSDTVSNLIGLGADVNCVNLSYGLTILAGAALFHDFKKLEILQEQGARFITEDPNSLIGLCRLVDKYPEDTLKTLLKDVPLEHITFPVEIFEKAIKKLGDYSIKTLEKWHAIGLPIQVGDTTVLQVFSDNYSEILRGFSSPIPEGKLRQDLLHQLESMVVDQKPLEVLISENGKRSRSIFQGLKYTRRFAPVSKGK